MGDWVFTSGIGPDDPGTGRPVTGDIADHTRQALQNLAAVLAAHGLEYRHVVRCTVHLADIHRDWDIFDQVYREFFHAPYPVRTTVGSGLGNGMLIELNAVAHRLLDCCQSADSEGMEGLVSDG
jgi:2-iminobutanoate/2-iminopropanoate deaminase